MDKFDIIKSLNKEIVDIQGILYNNGWCEEIEEYLLNNGFKKRVVETYYENIEVTYIRGDINIEMVNDLEIYISYKNDLLLLIEDDTDYNTGSKKVSISFDYKD